MAASIASTTNCGSRQICVPSLQLEAATWSPLFEPLGVRAEQLGRMGLTYVYAGTGEDRTWMIARFAWPRRAGEPIGGFQAAAAALLEDTFDSAAALALVQRYLPDASTRHEPADAFSPWSAADLGIPAIARTPAARSFWRHACHRTAPRPRPCVLSEQRVPDCDHRPAVALAGYQCRGRVHRAVRVGSADHAVIHQGGNDEPEDPCRRHCSCRLARTDAAPGGTGHRCSHPALGMPERTWPRSCMVWPAGGQPVSEIAERTGTARRLQSMRDRAVTGCAWRRDALRGAVSAWRHQQVVRDLMPSDRMECRACARACSRRAPILEIAS